MPTSNGLAPSRAVLDNGVVVLAKATHTTPAVFQVPLEYVPPLGSVAPAGMFRTLSSWS